ncbi:MAG: hypothetical protein Q7U73_06095 [Rubrivivax sp.]|nr:hypothetical protein [Rubrivivax sp.]
MTQRAQIQGKVTYREGDGVQIAIRPGPVEVQATASDVTLSWTDGQTHGSAAMPIGDFRRYVSEGLITLAQPLVMPAVAPPPT